MMTLRHRPRPALPADQEALVARLDAELRQRASHEQAVARAAHDQAQAAAAAKAARAEQHYRMLGLDVGGIAAFHRMLAGEDAAARGALRHAVLSAAPDAHDGRGFDPAAVASPYPAQQQVVLHSTHVRRSTATARGTGTGWFGSGAQQAGDTELWHFPWTPPATARYTFWPSVAFRGMYIAQAGDDFWTSKSARVAIGFQLHHWQDGWKHAARSGPSDGGTLWERGGGNVNECVGMDWEHRPTGAGIHEVSLVAGEPALLSVQLTLHACARGEGSYAEISAAGEGGFLACRTVVGTFSYGG